MTRSSTSLCSCVASLGLLATAYLPGTAVTPAQQPYYRALPPGVYAKVDIETAIKGFEGTRPSVPQLHAMLRSLYEKLLADPAITGIEIGEHWDHIQTPSRYPYEPVDGYDWSYLDDAFAVADQDHKPVQLLITPGLNSPPSVKAAITPSCNGLFSTSAKTTTTTAPVAPDCGKVTFPKVPEPMNADSHVLPLPWDPTYNTDWQGFLTELAARYQDNAEFASIAVAGPVAASTEMILPTSANTGDGQVDTMWGTLIQHRYPGLSGQALDEVFVTQWEQTIQDYEKAFSGITLVLTPDSGSDLPDFGHNVTQAPGNDLYDSECAASLAATQATNAALYYDLMSCEAKTEVLSYFVGASGPNGKATKVGGMTASNAVSLAQGDIGIPGVKLLTTLSPEPTPPLGAGAEFDFPLSSKKFQAEGCPSYPATCQGLTIDEAAYNVLRVFFDGTSHGADYGGTNGNEHVSFLGVLYPDVLYAEDHPCLDLQNLLDEASQDLTGRPVACVGGPPTSVAPPPVKY